MVSGVEPLVTKPRRWSPQDGSASWWKRSREPPAPSSRRGHREKTPSSPDAESACTFTIDVQSPELGETQVRCSTAQSVVYYHHSPEGLRQAPSIETLVTTCLSERSTGPHPRRRKTGHFGWGVQVALSALGVVDTKPLPPCSHYCGDRGMKNPPTLFSSLCKVASWWLLGKASHDKLTNSSEPTAWSQTQGCWDSLLWEAILLEPPCRL